MNKQNQAIGIFDSGVGGTTVFKEIERLMPNEHTIYLADSKNAPYGPKGKERIIELSVKNTEFLLQQDCKLIVVACNTATTNAISFLREQYDVPFIGIEPAIKPAALQSKSKAVGVLATKGTLSSSLFHSTSKKFASDVQVIESMGEGLVELIEQGKLESDELKTLLQKQLQPMIDAEVDYLVLGCTHYPYLIPILNSLMPEQVTIIDSGEAVARQTKTVLEANLLGNTSSRLGSHLFYTNSTNASVLYNLLDKKYVVEELDF